MKNTTWYVLTDPKTATLRPVPLNTANPVRVKATTVPRP